MTERGFVRPFVMTGGRTRVSGTRLELETIVAAIGPMTNDELAFEAQAIVDLCAAPMSIAEIAGRLQLPVGVIVVLVGDLVAQEALTVHHTDPVEIELSALRRMIDRVRAI